MALGDFWNRIRVLYRRLAPQPTRAPQRTVAPRPPVAPQQPVVQPPPPVGPLDTNNKMGIISQAGRSLQLLFIKYEGMSREVEPYSFRQKSTGLFFYGFCSIHQKIHSFRPEKIEEIQILNKKFSPRWPVEV